MHFIMYAIYYVKILRHLNFYRPKFNNINTFNAETQTTFNFKITLKSLWSHPLKSFDFQNNITCLLQNHMVINLS